MNRGLLLTIACVTLGVAASAQDNPRDRSRDSRDYRDNRPDNYSDVIPAGAQIPVRTDQSIDVRVPSDGRIFTGTVAEDVLSPSGNLMIPRGARAELIVHNLGEREGTVDLESIAFNGHRYMVDAEQYDLSRRTGIGTNERTAKYVGGGAVFGTLLGAIAGGGKGAAIGALAGGAAGAGAQTVTRGQAVRVPAETVLNFRLDQPLRMGIERYTKDNGYDENGNHYHTNYYNRDRDRNDRNQ